MFNGNGTMLFGNREEGEYIKTREQPARFFFLILVYYKLLSSLQLQLK